MTDMMIFTPEIDELPQFIDTTPDGSVHVLGSYSRRLERQGDQVVLTYDGGHEVVGQYADDHQAWQALAAVATPGTLGDALYTLHLSSQKVYLLHFDEPISPDHTCQHYLGWVKQNLDQRFHDHRHSPDARLLQVAKERGIRFTFVRSWLGNRTLERRIKDQHNSRDFCPRCSGSDAYGRMT